MKKEDFKFKIKKESDKFYEPYYKKNKFQKLKHEIKNMTAELKYFLYKNNKLDEFHVDISKKIIKLHLKKSNHKTCWGRGFTYIDSKGQPIICNCVDEIRAFVDWGVYIQFLYDIHKSKKYFLRNS